MTVRIEPRLRRFLFLQGNASPFFDRLGRALAARGHAVHRINFNGGDCAFWSVPGAVDYRDAPERWPAFLEQHLAQWHVTDIVLFGDCRPLHRAAIAVARARGLIVHVCDEGYLRPNWITVEEGGINGHSSLARDAAWFRTLARALPPWDGGQPVRNRFSRRALHDIAYRLSSLALKWRFPHYRTHRPHPPLAEYAGGAWRLARAPLSKHWLRRDLGRIRSSGRQYYLFPLQLEADTQIRFHSDFPCIEAAIECVVRSFAAHAPVDTLLAITEHPLDTSLKNWRRIVSRCAAAHDVSERVYFLERGTPELLLQHCRSLVTVNSTMGYLALATGKPVVALGRAIYDMPELTFQGGLDAFWTQAQPPDPASLDAFRRVVAARTQVNGGYFSAAGVALAVENLLARWSVPLPAVALPISEPDAATEARPRPTRMLAPAKAAASARDVVA